MKIISSWINVCADDWTVERVIIASNVNGDVDADGDGDADGDVDGMRKRGLKVNQLIERLLIKHYFHDIYKWIK